MASARGDHGVGGFGIMDTRLFSSLGEHALGVVPAPPLGE